MPGAHRSGGGRGEERGRAAEEEQGPQIRWSERRGRGPRARGGAGAAAP